MILSQSVVWIFPKLVYFQLAQLAGQTQPTAEAGVESTQEVGKSMGCGMQALGRKQTNSLAKQAVTMLAKDCCFTFATILGPVVATIGWSVPRLRITTW